MSLKRNILANYISQIYVTLIGIVMVPIYVRYMGAEAYGLVGFFAMLQAWFNLLDLGLTPTIGREAARFRAGAMNALEFRRLFRSLSCIFSGVAICGGVGMFLLSSEIARKWLKVETLPLSEIESALQIMAISIALRWMGGLYRGVVTGSERLVWLSGFNAFIATMRFIVVLPVMWYFGYTPFVFFIHQLAVALLEVLGLWLKTFHLLPKLKQGGERIGWSLASIKPVLKFSLTIAFTSCVWVVVTQTDKLVLSSILPLAEYGYFTLAVLAASGIIVVSGPISNAIMPRMAKLHTEGRDDELIQVYRNATQIVSIIVGAIAITLVCCAEPLLLAWTKDVQLAAKASPILRLYAIGNGLLAIGAFPYYLQYAKGNLRYHLLGNIGMVLVLIPCVIYVSLQFGAIGAGYVWLATNGLYLLSWVAYIHHKLEPGLHKKWLFNDVIKIVLPGIVMALLIYVLGFHPMATFERIIYLLLVGILVLSCNLFFAKFVWRLPLLKNMRGR